MGFSRMPFHPPPGSPPPLVARAVRRVRFEDLDPMGVMWHGKYASFLDDGRVALGDLYPELSYARFVAERVAAPVAELHINFRAPARLDDRLEIVATHYYSEAARIDIAYRVRVTRGPTVADAWSIQLLASADGNFLPVLPDWLAEFREAWRAGKLIRHS